MRPIIFLVRRIVLATVVVDDKAIECRGFLKALIQEKIVNTTERLNQAKASWVSVASSSWS